ncbi:MAG: SusE domain-containing protein [Flavobacterium sp.]|nr:SusE domain-containing protein [Flavobacterium sp.]
MKHLSKLFLLATIVVTLFSACDKVESLPYYEAATSTTLSVSSSTIAVAPADSSKTAVTFSWTYPGFAIDSTKAKYILEIDSTGRNFAKAVSKTLTGSLSASYTGKELNNLLLGFGFTIGTAYDVDIRVTASYGNNNNQLKSNTIKVKMTPYKVPPKVALPTTGKLFLVGDASQGDWNNPVPTPSQEFARLDETTFAGVFNLNGGKQYLVLPENGSWASKFAVDDNSIAGLSAGGTFGFNVGTVFNANFPGPATSGWYKILLDFQTGKFAVTPYTSTLPDSLYIVGDATPGGWNNPVPTPSQKFTRLNSVEFSLTLNGVVGGKEYLMLPKNGDWGNKYAVSDNSVIGLSAGGDFGYNLPKNFPGPAVGGNYKIDVNFATLKFKTTKL